MMRRLAFAVALVSFISGAIGLAQQAPPTAAGPAGGRGAAQAAPAAPPPGSPALYKSNAELLTALKEAAGRSVAGAQTAAVSNTDRYRINVVRRVQGGAPLTHAGNTELHHIIDGSATVVTGGKVVRDAKGATVEGGISRHVTKGDVIIVPADTPHWYKEVDGTVTYLEVRFVVPTNSR